MKQQVSHFRTHQSTFAVEENLIDEILVLMKEVLEVMAHKVDRSQSENIVRSEDNHKYLILTLMEHLRKRRFFAFAVDVQDLDLSRLPPLS